MENVSPAEQAAYDHFLSEQAATVALQNSGDKDAYFSARRRMTAAYEAYMHEHTLRLGPKQFDTWDAYYGKPKGETYAVATGDPEDAAKIVYPTPPAHDPADITVIGGSTSGRNP